MLMQCSHSAKSFKVLTTIFYMCSLDYESILNPNKKEENKKYIQYEHIQKEFTKAMEGPGGYFLEPGGYIVDKRNTESQHKSVV
jgi:hypothetical protein